MSKVGYIYKIKDNTNGDVYYGSTTQTVSRRITSHRSYYKAGRTKCSSSCILKNGDWSYFTVEKFEYDEKFQLRNREQTFIDNNECVNKVRAYCSVEFREQYKKEHNNAYQQKYRDRQKLLSK